MGRNRLSNDQNGVTMSSGSQASTKEVLVNPAYPNQLVTIGRQFSKKCREQFISMLGNNLDVFAWQPSDMTGVPKRIIKHMLNADPSVQPNAGATYQRLMGQNLEAYVDDIVIKSKIEDEVVADIAETFDNLQKINMKLNPRKCSFGVTKSKFLGYMITSEGIRSNPKKTKAVADMRSPMTLKEMQSLSGKLAALSRFLARSAERGPPVYEAIDHGTHVVNNSGPQRDIVRIFGGVK
ncbi:reverse transcriptase domain-containing protein [Tanacetum coccineum]